MLSRCWASVCDAGPAPRQRWMVFSAFIIMAMVVEHAYVLSRTLVTDRRRDRNDSPWLAAQPWLLFHGGDTCRHLYGDPPGLSILLLPSWQMSFHDHKLSPILTTLESDVTWHLLCQGWWSLWRYTWNWEYSVTINQLYCVVLVFLVCWLVI